MDLGYCVWLTVIAFSVQRLTATDRLPHHINYLHALYYSPGRSLSAKRPR